jgi:hypothetical protein
MKKLLTLGLLLFFTFCATEGTDTAQKDVVELLPLSNEISGWTRSGDMQVAETESELYDLIDGEGQVFIDNGFVKCAFQDYQGDVSGETVTLEADIFDMDNSTNAENVYDDVGIGGETPWTDNHAGVEARIDEGLLSAYKIDFWDDKFYARIIIHRKTQAALDIAKLFALNISAEIRE